MVPSSSVKNAGTPRMRPTLRHSQHQQRPPSRRETTQVNIRQITRTAVGAAVVIGGVSMGVGTAQADYAPSYTDVVGISGDTPQLPINFGADGDILGDAGYNASNNPNKLANFNATADVNGRSPFYQNSTTALNPTVVYR